MSNPTQPQPVSIEALMAQLAAAQAENAKLKSKATTQVVNKVALRVSEKGALSLYGMGRFPVTLYREQWLKVLAMADDIRAFIEANPGLKTKDGAQ
jgi:hypothetical protein